MPKNPTPNKWLTGRSRIVFAGLAALLVLVVVVVAVVTRGDDDTPDDRASDEQSKDTTTTAAQSEDNQTTSTDQATNQTSTSEAGNGETGNSDNNDTGDNRDRGGKASQPDQDPAGPLEENPPVGFDEVGDFGTGLEVELLGITAVKGEARLPGEVAGPALQVKVQATNTGTKPLSLVDAQLEVFYSPQRTPGLLLGAPGVVEFPDTLAPGESATATYVYAIPVDQRDDLHIQVLYSVDAPIVVFEGSAE